MIEVTVSSKWARHLFACSEDYIKTTCYGRCCQGTDRILVSLTEGEAAREIAKGRAVVDGLLQADARGLCPNKRLDGLCAVHGTPDKPFGCIASPFTLNANGTLIIRNRYTKMKCHGHGKPAYQVFKASIMALFGWQHGSTLYSWLDNGGDDTRVPMQDETYRTIMGLDRAKHPAA